MHKPYTIDEYGSFVSDKDSSGNEQQGYIALPEKTFAQLEQFILSTRNRETDALELMGLSARKGVGKIITAKNYVGLIAMKDGMTIEILPKIYSKTGVDKAAAKRLVIDMLKTLRNAPYKNLQTAQVNLARMSLFEIFIQMLIEEVFRIAKHGLKSDYVPIEANETFFKGKMLFSEQIKRNLAHKERAFVAYDSYSVDRAENRILKTTLDYLYRVTASSRNKANLKTLLGFFADVSLSQDYRQDFEKCASDRAVKDYETALQWCKVFLEGRSFTAFSGSEVALALLFPMETLFESYIAAQFRKLLKSGEYELSVQDKRYHLFEKPSCFQMRPDLVLTRKSDGAIFILDTKWKLLSDEKVNYGISQADMYQMVAYQKKYGAKSVTLLYPMTDQVSAGKQISYQSDDGTTVQVRFVDLFDVPASLSTLSF
jgi:5-methylcytosine-specific restriction enzyme subunit McrC